MIKDQITFLYRHQVLEDANKAVRAGTPLTPAEASVVLEVIRSKRCKQWPDGSHHYSSHESDAAFLIGDVVLPEAVELSAIKVVREAPRAPAITKRKRRIPWDWIESTAYLLAGKGVHETRASLIRELLALYIVEFPGEKPPSEDNNDLRRIAKEALARAGQ
jgi:hypothetical protein